ncbi:MAG TPA: tRNA (guanosine(37)-N1)-methyltransferase TrmD [Patescibacteria group bacterium]
MKIQILTLFPNMFVGPFDESIIKRAKDKKLVNIEIKDLRSWGLTERKTVDDRPYGGGVGMVMMVEPIYNALKDLKTKDTTVILLTPQGKVFNQSIAKDLSKQKDIILICGHYEGFDERIRSLVDEEISVGDFVLTGGELPAMLIADTIVRLIPGVLEKEDAVKFESFSDNLLEYPQYTRPEDFKGMTVPKVLLSGNHKEIENWRKEESLKKTKKNRSDLLK